jgi:23S rRNA U2552 (ribose-2'-O)-methylase RlmE/FtsJ
MKINDCEKEWDIFKKHTNPYEYIHTMIPNKKKYISKCKPLSRSYFKMIEIVHTFRLHDIFDNIKSFHLAEGPGGFIEALVQQRQNRQVAKLPSELVVEKLRFSDQNTGDTYVGMTILDENAEMDDYNIPAWKKSQQFLKENTNVFIENGADGTGNILNIENFVYCKDKYASSMDLITADGGFDFSNDFNNQEISIANLLFAQIAYALCMQKKNGSFVLKIFDCFMPHTIDLLFILSSFYDKVYITKPQTSRYANSEKYIVCKKFLFSSCDDFYPFLYEAFTGACHNNNNNCIHRFLNIPISNYFLTKLEEYNSIFGQQQIENIYYTISLIETKNKAEKIDMLIKANIQKCIQWCLKYDVPHNTITGNTNIFLSS